jgi:GH24 family phage-related lysozyme (muramidase)
MSLMISDAALDLIVAEEDSSPAYYAKHYQHFEWPEGASGPTIGIGYDCGYVTREEAAIDWSGILSETMMAVVTRACGLRGQVAAAFVRAHRNEVTVTWDQALQEFREREVPKWIAQLQAHLPNLVKLSPDSLGALLSLAYNRGPSFDAPGPRYAEMRAIKSFLAAQNFSRIPAEFLSMRRLWPAGGDLWKRRGHEAALFQKGLAA